MAPPTEIKAAGSNVAVPSASSSQPLRPPQPSSASSSSSLSAVLVDGISFTSEITYSLYPLERLLNKILPELLLRTYLRKLKIVDVLLFNTAFAKSALDEYAAKLNTRPTYNTVKLEGPPPCFECSVIFDGTQYTGDTAKDKSEA
ncbi:hypothetical protein Ahy_A03g011346 isoform B [Arachis hypogaea]|uniref:DRBM domain-containing protein n=1 Tax=Arachis hypogaea TaxID=3818 RepID=A0A445DQG4_ARAHY|nr:hypothetical protein Ahy_A03g011346 isoform B [Arachis hypogaea]